MIVERSLMSSIVCHPALRIRWFESVSQDMHAKAAELFNFYFDQYKSSATQDPTLPSASQPVGDNDFLSSLVRRTSSLSQVVAEPLSEQQRYAHLNHGINEQDALTRPLLWWKVSSSWISVHHISLLPLARCHGPISMSFQSSLGWREIFLPFPALSSLWNVCHARPSFFLFFSFSFPSRTSRPSRRVWPNSSSSVFEPPFLTSSHDFFFKPALKCKTCHYIYSDSTHVQSLPVFFDFDADFVRARSCVNSVSVIAPTP